MNGFMRNRRGSDELSWTLIGLSVILTLIFAFINVWWLGFIPLLPVAYALFRIFSTNIEARESENDIILGAIDECRFLVLKIRERKTTVYLKCPDCGTRMKIKRGQGQVRVKCPRCQQFFEHDTGK